GRHVPRQANRADAAERRSGRAHEVRARVVDLRTRSVPDFVPRRRRARGDRPALADGRSRRRVSRARTLSIARRRQARGRGVTPGEGPSGPDGAHPASGLRGRLRGLGRRRGQARSKAESDLEARPAGQIGALTPHFRALKLSAIRTSSPFLHSYARTAMRSDSARRSAWIVVLLGLAPFVARSAGTAPAAASTPLPAARTVDSVQTRFGPRAPDPYRWAEPVPNPTLTAW